MELLYILREWVLGEGEELKTFTLDELVHMEKVMDMDNDTFTHYITGLHCDSYADTSCDIMEDMYRDCSMYDSENKLEGCYNRCMREYDFLTCYTVYRLWNPQHTKEVALAEWKDSCICTLEGIIEAKELEDA